MPCLFILCAQASQDFCTLTRAIVFKCSSWNSFGLWLGYSVGIYSYCSESTKLMHKNVLDLYPPRSVCMCTFVNKGCFLCLNAGSTSCEFKGRRDIIIPIHC